MENYTCTPYCIPNCKGNKKSPLLLHLGSYFSYYQLNIYSLGKLKPCCRFSFTRSLPLIFICLLNQPHKQNGQWMFNRCLAQVGGLYRLKLYTQTWSSDDFGWSTRKIIPFIMLTTLVQQPYFVSSTNIGYTFHRLD